MELNVLIGSNATGKSSRMRYLYDFLQSKGLSEKIITRPFTNKRGITKEAQMGILFENGVLLLGGNYNSTAGWASLDELSKKGINTIANRNALLNEMAASNEYITHVYCEGYFNCAGTGFRPEALHNNLTGYDKIDVMVMHYDEPQEFIDRCNLRTSMTFEITGKKAGVTGSDVRDMAWCLASAGWGDNQGFRTFIRKAAEQVQQDYITIERVDVNAPMSLLKDRRYGK